MAFFRRRFNRRPAVRRGGVRRSSTRRFGPRRTVRRRYGPRRYRVRKAINMRPAITKFVSYDMQLRMFNDASFPTQDHFMLYLAFNPTANVVSPTVSTSLQLSNFPITVNPMGTIQDSEANSWNTIYSKTKLKKVIVKYRPSQTMGVTNVVSATGASTFAAQDAVMTTCPIYDNVDDVVSSADVMLTAPTAVGLQHIRQKPYAREHSIYKPWKRILKPSAYVTWNDFNASASYRRKVSTPWIDMIPAQTYSLHGFMMMMPPIRRGGELTATTTPTLYPGGDNFFVLGTITFTYVQLFKLRE